MNIAFYVDSLTESDQTSSIFDIMNSLVEKSTVKDASLFYNKIDFNSKTPKFGMFNATEMWGYNGVLISTTAKNAIVASSVVNSITNYYLFNPTDINVFELIRVAQQMPVLVNSEEDRAYVQRVTGFIPRVVETSEEGVTALLRGEA